MSFGNKAKAKLLGKSFGAANGQLRKALLFEFAGLLGLRDCYQCGIEIDGIGDFSMEHKEPWGSAEDPVAAFFDLGNIAFSHIKCNVAAAKRPNKKYASAKEYKAAKRRRWYVKNSEQYLARKRVTYSKNMGP